MLRIVIAGARSLESVSLHKPERTPEAAAALATPAADAGVANVVMRSMLWLFGQTAASRAVQAASQIALAWLLQPADFGQISLALMVSGIASTAFQFGLDDVVVQRGHKMPLWFGTLFWLSVGPALLCALALVAVAPLAAHIYHQPQLVGMLAVIAASIPLRAFGAIPSAIIRSQLNFRLLSMLTLAEAIGVSVATLALAAAGFGAYSFVLPIPIFAAAYSAVSWWLTKATFPRRRSNFRWTALLSSSTAVSISRLLNVLVGHGNYMVLGLVAGDVRVGLYFFAYRIAGQPVRLLAGSITNVLFPAIVRLGDDPLRQRDAVLLASHVLAIVIMPICFLQAALARPFLDYFFQPQWSDAAFYIQLLSIGFAFDAVSWTVGALLPARGEFNRALRYVSVTTGLFFVFIIVGALLDADYGVAIGATAFYVIVQPIYCYVVLSAIGNISMAQVAGIYVVPATLGALTAFGSASLFTHSGQLVIAPLLALAVYAICARYLAPRPSKYIITRLRALLSRA